MSSRTVTICDVCKVEIAVTRSQIVVARVEVFPGRGAFAFDVCGVCFPSIADALGKPELAAHEAAPVAPDRPTPAST